MRYVADFDSASGLLRALAARIHGRGFDRLGQSRLVGILVRGANLVPPTVRQHVYSWGGWVEALPSEKLGTVSWSAFGDWVVDRYPKGSRWPALFIGASNGAAVHLAAAMGAPWLPQTFLVPVRRHGDPDDARSALEFGRQHAPQLLDANPDLHLHHMHDPNQDRLMVRHMTYFRVKGGRLPPAYVTLLQQRLEPNATVYVLDCGATWPVTRVGERHVFQHGAVGGLEPDEYHHGGDKVRRFLRQAGSDRDRWYPPATDEEAPEAEWGYRTSMTDHIVDVAARRGHRVVRVAFDRPEQLSLAVADLHRAWYDRIGAPQRRLIAETFILTDPHRVLRHRAVPLWLTFPVKHSETTLRRHLDQHDDYDEALLTLFSHGIDSVGVVPVDRWRHVLERAGYGVLLGVDDTAFPADFATFTRYSAAMDEATDDVPPPPALPPDEMEHLLEEHAPRHGVSLEVMHS